MNSIQSLARVVRIYFATMPFSLEHSCFFSRSLTLYRFIIFDVKVKIVDIVMECVQCGKIDTKHTNADVLPLLYALSINVRMSTSFSIARISFIYIEHLFWTSCTQNRKRFEHDTKKKNCHKQRIKLLLRTGRRLHSKLFAISVAVQFSFVLQTFLNVHAPLNMDQVCTKVKKTRALPYFLLTKSTRANAKMTVSKWVLLLLLLLLLFFREFIF